MQDAANEAQGVCEGFKSSGLVSSGGPLRVVAGMSWGGGG
jgi:hypothetical protein